MAKAVDAPGFKPHTTLCHSQHMKGQDLFKMWRSVSSYEHIYLVGREVVSQNGSFMFSTNAYAEYNGTCDRGNKMPASDVPTIYSAGWGKSRMTSVMSSKLCHCKAAREQKTMGRLTVVMGSQRLSVIADFPCANEV